MYPLLQALLPSPYIYTHGIIPSSQMLQYSRCKAIDRPVTGRHKGKDLDMTTGTAEFKTGVKDRNLMSLLSLLSDCPIRYANGGWQTLDPVISGIRLEVHVTALNGNTSCHA